MRSGQIGSDKDPLRVMYKWRVVFPPRRKVKEGKGRRTKEGKGRKREGGEEKGGGREKWRNKGKGRRKKELGCVYDPLGHQGAYQSPQLDKAGKPQANEGAPLGKDKSPKHMYTTVHDAIRKKIAQ